MPFTNEVPKWDAFLGEFEARQSADDLKTDLELTHEPCGEVLTDVQHGDNQAAWSTWPARMSASQRKASRARHCLGYTASKTVAHPGVCLDKGGNCNGT